MRDGDWVQFFNMLGEIVNANAPATEKFQACRDAAERLGYETDFEEFVQWCKDAEDKA